MKKIVYLCGVFALSMTSVFLAYAVGCSSTSMAAMRKYCVMVLADDQGKIWEDLRNKNHRRN